MCRVPTTFLAAACLLAATYDASGNVTTWNGNAYTYDPFHLMWDYKTGTDEWIYLYTADDERAWSYKTDNTSLWTLRSLDAKVLREYTSNGTWSVAEDYIYRDGLLLAAETPAGTRHLHLDHLGTPRLVSNNLGQQQAYHVYYPYGEEATAFNQDTIREKFTGHERDLGNLAGAGDDLDYMHARHESPWTGRFLSLDPKNRYQAARSPRLWNRYVYSAGNPLKYIDPNGEEIALASGGRQDALKLFLVRTAVHPSSRANMKQIADSKTFKLLVSERQLNSPAQNSVAQRSKQGQDWVFGRTNPEITSCADGAVKVIKGATMAIDAAAVQGHHYSDRTGVATTAHEFYHAVDMLNQKSQSDIAAGDKPSNTTGPAAQFGDAAAHESADMTEEEAKKFVEGLLSKPPTK